MILGFCGCGSLLSFCVGDSLWCWCAICSPDGSNVVGAKAAGLVRSKIVQLFAPDYLNNFF